MKTIKSLLSVWMAGSAALVFVLADPAARASVYATDIQINGSLSSVTSAAGAPVSITYRLNQPATAGVTIKILQGSAVVATMSGGTAMGLNAVSWTPSANGTYSVSITAGAVGFPLWTQISVDTNSGMPAYFPLGMDVNKNTGSPYYGRVIMGCAAMGSGSSAVVPPAAQKSGLYKMNADGTQADEGWYGNAGYTNDDGGDTAVAGQMPNSDGNNPVIIRIGQDDRIYWCDDSDLGAIVACDMRATTNQVVINESGYANNPDLSYLDTGIKQFDVAGAGTASGALWLCNADSPNWGIWMYHLAGGVADPRDTEGTQAVYAGAGSDLAEGSTGGCMVDSNLDIFVSQDPSGNDPVFRAMEYTNWNHGALPPEAGGFNYALGHGASQVRWGVGSSDATFVGVRDTAINSRAHPTMVALPMANPNNVNTFVGLRVLNTTNGSVVTATNGATVQTLTNLDPGNAYTCAAWDNVGNLYGASPTRFLWRVWSPPGSNQATTVAVPQIIVGTPFAITGIAAIPANSDCATLVIHFAAPASLAASSFRLMSSPSVNGAYSVASGASIAGGSGVYQATVTACATEFYKIQEVPPATITGINAIPAGSGCATLIVTFTASGNPAVSAFKLLGSPSVNGPYTAVTGAVVSGASGSFQAIAQTCATQFYRIAQSTQ